MADHLNPLLDTLPATLQDMRKQIDNLSRSRQQYFGAWIDLNPSDFTIDSANSRILISAFTPSSKFNEGDLIRIIQSPASTYSYFAVIDVKPTYISLFGGLNYTLTANAVTSIGYSKVAGAQGINSVFATTPVIKYSNGTNVTILFQGERVYLIGPVVFVEGYATVTTVGTNLDLFLYTPVQNTNETDRGIDPVTGSITPPAGDIVGSTTQMAYMFPVQNFGSLPTNDYYSRTYRIDGVSLVAGTYRIDYRYSYRLST